ncbi:MAG: patatin-like phospholipase family protein [Syntrophales bacterium]
MSSDNNDLALVLSGGGAHAAYQVGFLRSLADQFPHLNIPILTGVSAGAINATFIANHQGTFAEAVDALSDFWLKLEPTHVFNVNAWTLSKNILRWGLSLLSGGMSRTRSPKGLVDTTPLRKMLQKGFKSADGGIIGIRENIQQQKLKALAITATNYATGQTITWVQGKNIEMWERPDRHSVMTDITVDQIMASTSLPIFFPAIKVGDSWYGDGVIRQSAPLSPSLHLGAGRILAISTRHKPFVQKARSDVSRRYPSIAQIMGILMNAIFLDFLDQDALGLERVNRVLANTSSREDLNLRLVRAFVLRPSVDLGMIAGKYERDLPRLFRFFMRGLGTRETENFDWLSMVMFVPSYVRYLMEIGAADANTRKEEIAALLAS